MGSTTDPGQKKRQTGSRVHRSRQQKSTARLYGTDLAGQTEIWAGKKVTGQTWQVKLNYEQSVIIFGQSVFWLLTCLFTSGRLVFGGSEDRRSYLADWFLDSQFLFQGWPYVWADLIYVGLTVSLNSHYYFLVGLKIWASRVWNPCSIFYWENLNVNCSQTQIGVWGTFWRIS